MGFLSREGLHVEELADGYLVLDAESERVYQLTGDQAEAFALARAGAKRLPDDLTTAMAGLVELGLVETTDWSRRKVLQMGGAAAAAAVVMLNMPSVAAAGSVVSMQYLVVAGGGGGGAGGGGAGEVLENTAGVVVTPTTWGVAETYNVTLGGGGGYNVYSLLGNNIPYGSTGANSTLSGAKLTGTLTTRGGGGQAQPPGVGADPGLAGGSGGGGGVNGGLTLPTAGSAGGASTAVSPGMGNKGGKGGNASLSNKTNGSGGGGGGAGGAGGDFVANTNGSNYGGVGVVSTLASNWSNSPAATKVGQQNPSTTSQWFVGGGGGGAGYQYYGSGGLGGGGDGGSQSVPSTHPDAYLYTGGGGGGQGIGSSGIVIVAVSPPGHVHPPSGQASVYAATISGVDYLVFTNPNTSTVSGSGDAKTATTIANFSTTFTIT